MKLFQRLPAGRLASLLQRLAVQGAMSAVVMAGLHAASGSGTAFKEWLATPNDSIAANEPGALAPSPQFTFVGVPAGEALPTREIEGPNLVATSAVARPSPIETDARNAPARPLAPATAQKSIAVPTPRPVRVAMAEARSAPLSAERRPADLPFDLSVRHAAEAEPVRAMERMALSGAPELVSDEVNIPDPGETASSTLAGLLPLARIPSGQGLLRSAGDVTLIASDALVGTASRVLDLVR